MTTTHTNKNKKRATVLALAAALAIPFEGLRQFAYYDPPGILTVCYGSTTDVVKGRKYSLNECKVRLDQDMLNAVIIVENCTKDIDLSVNQMVAFADMVYNIGPRPVCDADQSTLARKLQAGDVMGACDQIPRWNKARVAGQMVALPGLTKRRTAETNLCKTPDPIVSENANV
jgi:GH24 family phage-related lysozyme (muramidase)